MRASVAATDCDTFGLMVGARQGPTATGLVELMTLHAPTVGEALRTLFDGLKTSDTGGAAPFGRSGGEAWLGYQVIAPDIAGADQIVDGAIAVGFNILRALCGPAWRPLRVRLPRKPPRDRAPFLRLFGSPVEFGAPSAASCSTPPCSTPRSRAATRDRRDPRAAPRRGAGRGDRRFRGLGPGAHPRRTRRARPHARNASPGRWASASARSSIGSRRAASPIPVSPTRPVRRRPNLPESGQADLRRRGPSRLRRPQRLHPRLQGVVGTTPGRWRAERSG